MSVGVTMRSRLLAAVCIGGLASAAISTSARADTSIATTRNPTGIRAWGGVAAFSLFDEASGTYRLAISRNGGPPEILAVAAQATPFDVDVGPDKAGSATLVYSRCGSPGPRPRRCDLYRYSLSRAAERKLRGPSTLRGSETAPTIWRTRLAWARLPGAGATRTPRVYTRTLSAPRSRPSRRLPGPRLCGRYGCTVNELELRGRRLALNVGYPGSVCDDGLIQLDSLAGRAIRVAEQPCGLSGRRFVGVSFDAHNLYFARFCEGGCDPGEPVGVFRYSLTRARFLLARFNDLLTGFSYDAGGRAYEVVARENINGYCGNTADDIPPGSPPLPVCEVLLTDPLDFARTRAPFHPRR
jgi:hypothetical protein